MKDALPKVFVGGLPTDVSESELFQLFTDSGLSIVGAKIIRDHDTGQSKGFGFCELRSQRDYDAALAMDGTSFRNRSLNIRPALRPARGR